MLRRGFLFCFLSYRYAYEKTSAPVFFTLCRLNSPRITIEKKGDYSCKNLEIMGTVYSELREVSFD